MTTIGVPTTASPATTLASGRRAWAQVRRVLPYVAVPLLAGELIWMWPSMTDAVSAAARASTWLLVFAAALEAGSVVAFALTTKLALRAAGGSVPLRTAVATTAASGALHNVLPAGNLVSTGFTFGRLRRWGATPAAATWCLAITGVVASAGLGIITVVALAAASDSTTVSALVSAALSVALVVGVAFIARHPQWLSLMAERCLTLVNRLTRKPADRGLAALHRTVGDLRSVRPRPSDWAAMSGASLANWLLDLGALLICASAFGLHVELPVLLLVYSAGMATSSISPIPGGIGLVEGAMIVGLTTAGAAAPLAIATVLTYRLISVGGITLAGLGVLGHERLRGASAAPVS